ncbi:cyclase family protein [Brevibacterium ravenspurgense]|uniref:cyclase family protein n=1 Tax=Brevibacterium ravenspurgense TaxID=479117 RepID=UPI001EF3AA51|nr:cyclase family protein [Brevibacterium ravenspurgense]MCG7299985.1 cyclase family protein [Brevibacterium ravenspurgense]
MSENKEVPHVRTLVDDGPKNWGKWGPDDEVGALNYLTPEKVAADAACIRSGKTFTLGLPIGDPDGDPIWPGRSQPQRVNIRDRGDFLAGAGIDYPGGLEDSDDMIVMSLQGSTQYDALGHVWYDDHIWNGYAAETTAGGLRKASVQAIAERGVVGRGVLIDMARHRNKKVLGRGETFTHEDLLDAADQQGVEIRKGDILIVRTGWIGSFYYTPKEEFYRDFLEPGLTYSKELVQWFADMEIPNLATDTIANEVTFEPETGVLLPLHNALMRNLGITLAEILLLDALAADCAEDGQWDFFYTAGPLKIVRGTGAPVNPIAIK